MRRWYFGILIICIAMLAVGYAQKTDKKVEKTEKMIELKYFPVDDLKWLVTQTVVEFDDKVSIDGKGSLKITVQNPTTINLYETGKVEIENARLIYKAKVKTEKIEGQVYLEMWCIVKGKGYFSRGLDKALTGSVDWTALEIPFFFKKGETPDNVKLNIVINGKGTVWIDDIHIMKGPLK